MDFSIVAVLSDSILTPFSSLTLRLLILSNLPSLTTVCQEVMLVIFYRCHYEPEAAHGESLARVRLRRTSGDLEGRPWLTTKSLSLDRERLGEGEILSTDDQDKMNPANPAVSNFEIRNCLGFSA